jgi:L-lactate dehydrogenase (cytochrome)
VFEFVDGGAGSEVTLRANREAFARWRFDPRWLTDVSHRDTSTTVLGERVDMPVLLAPAGLARLAHTRGELDAARAAGKAGTIFAVSTASSYTVEQIADVATGPLWFQLYLWKSDDVVKRLIERVKAAGYKAIVLTIDTPFVGNRERDIRNAAGLPPRITLDTALDAATKLGWVRDFYANPEIRMANLDEIVPPNVGAVTAFVDRELNDPAATWERLDWLRRLWDGPLAVKGVLSVRDAQEAVRRGADAIYISNHGGRQLDSSPATLEALPRIAEAVGDKAEILLDGGVRRGEDAVKARALGARAVLGGRLWFHAIGAGGEPVLDRLLELVRADVARTLGLIGVPRFDDVGRDAVVPAWS